MKREYTGGLTPIVDLMKSALISFKLPPRPQCRFFEAATEIDMSKEASRLRGKHAA